MTNTYEVIEEGAAIDVFQLSLEQYSKTVLRSSHFEEESCLQKMEMHIFHKDIRLTFKLDGLCSGNDPQSLYNRFDAD